MFFQMKMPNCPQILVLFAAEDLFSSQNVQVDKVVPCNDNIEDWHSHYMVNAVHIVETSGMLHMALSHAFLY